MTAQETSAHVAPLRPYFAVFAALLAFTGVTVWVAEHDFGPLNTLIALAIAGFKATLVVLFFMHVRSSSRLTKLFAAAGFFWLLILIGFTLADFASRGWLRIYG
jgi:cytochrome c oxidase subunit 4